MSLYFNAFVALLGTLAAFVLLAKLAQTIRLRQSIFSSDINGRVPAPETRSHLAIEQTCMLDGKRRLVLVRCDEQRVLVLTGGPTDLVIPMLGVPQGLRSGEAGA